MLLTALDGEVIRREDQDGEVHPLAFGEQSLQAALGQPEHTLIPDGRFTKRLERRLQILSNVCSFRRRTDEDCGILRVHSRTI
jgi:hypothetical protein